ncbi:hypothetical protein [Streptomyces sp. NBC_00470]|uniref:hypothetical protein n=1 Tax=Streptomyces sp. NBC_00470 TaxID=2975753 RepID=UPI002F90ED4B
MVDRMYLVTNPTALVGSHRRIKFRSPAPLGQIVRVDVDGRLVDVLLTGDPLHGGLLGAELQCPYL